MKKNKKRLKDYRITKKAQDKHKGVMTTLWIITYILFFPLGIIQLLATLIEEITDVCGAFRNNLVYTIFIILFKNDCKYVEPDEDEENI